MPKIKVMLVDDQTILRAGLRSLLEAQEDIAIVGEAENGAEAVDKALKLEPDVILMDIRMPQMDGVSATKQIKAKQPGTVIIVLTTFDDDEYIIKAMTYGAAGYLLKDIESDKLVQSIRDGVNGNIILPGRIAAKITSHIASSGSNELNVNKEMFSNRELDIIQLLVKGKSNHEIAETLFLSVGTVKNYISQIYMKLDVSDRANAVIALKKLDL